MVNTWVLGIVIYFIASFSALYIVSEIHISKGGVNDQKEQPRNMSEAIAVFDKGLYQEEKSLILSASELDMTTLDQQEVWDIMPYRASGVARSVRGAFELWEESELTRWFAWRGYRHPDAISHAIYKQYVSHLNGNEVSSYAGSRCLILAFLAVFVTMLCSAGFLILKRMPGSGLKIQD